MTKTLLTWLAATLATATAAGAQSSLREALRLADKSAYGNRIAAGAADAQRGQSLLPLKGILPSLRVEGGFIRTTDPIGAFGTTLRQRSITQANFDPQRLNFPAAVSNYTGGLVLEQPLFNADAWTGRAAASRAADASRASQEWTRLSTRVDVVRAWYGVVLAAERVTMLRQATQAALAHVAQAEAMVRQGMVTKSDALLASVRAGDVQSQLAESEGVALTARQQLAVLLGGDGAAVASPTTLTTLLPTAERIRAAVAPDTASIKPQTRADVQAATLGSQAARADARRAKSAYLPRINSFARYDWNSPARLYGGDKNWTVGIMSSWSPFAGASEIAEVQMTSGRSASASAQAEAAQASARLDVEQTRIGLSVALTRLAIAERSVAQSAEARRIVARKYQGGLATIAELLDAQASETQTALGFAHARYTAIVAGAERRRALGGDPAALTVLDDPASADATITPSAVTSPVAVRPIPPQR